jgi:hypothetical protein
MTKRVVSTAVIGVAVLAVLQAQTPYPRTFTDGRGHTITLTAKPARIASTVLGVDENLMELVDPSRIVAMTEIAKKMPDVSNIAAVCRRRRPSCTDRSQAIAAVKAGRIYAILGKHITTTSHLIVSAVTDVQSVVAARMR